MRVWAQEHGASFHSYRLSLDGVVRVDKMYERTGLASSPRTTKGSVVCEVEDNGVSRW
jgi:hypothetical protein